MALATTADLEALGALKIGASASDDTHARATRLLELASAVVVTYVRATEATIGGWDSSAQTAVSAVAAEVAARRLTSPAAPTADQLGPAPHMTVRLWPSDKDALNEIPEVVDARKAARPTSIGASRSNSWHLTTGRLTESTF